MRWSAAACAGGVACGANVMVIVALPAGRLTAITMNRLRPSSSEALPPSARESFPAKVRSAGSRPMSPCLASRSASAPCAIFSSDPPAAGAKETVTSASGLWRTLIRPESETVHPDGCQNWKSSLRYKPRALDAAPPSSAGPPAVGSAAGGGGAAAGCRSPPEVGGVGSPSSTNANVPSTYALQAATATTSVAASRAADRVPGDGWLEAWATSDRPPGSRLLRER
jgi:hypothetical protein